MSVLFYKFYNKTFKFIQNKYTIQTYIHTVSVTNKIPIEKIFTHVIQMYVCTILKEKIFPFFIHIYIYTYKTSRKKYK